MSTNKLVCFHCNEPIEGECISFDNHIFHVGCARKYENNKNGRIYECPECKTTGVVQMPYKETIESVPNPYSPGDFEENITVHFKDFNCEICDGHGYTKKPLKPIIKIVGWEDEETNNDSE